MVSLKRREDFVRLRGGVRWSTDAFVIETKRRSNRPDTHEAEAGPRFGFTVTKKLGGAVARNRIRRRLKEALRCLEPDVALPGNDYVVIARAAASDVGFERLKQDLLRGLIHVNERCGGRRTAGPRTDTVEHGEQATKTDLTRRRASRT